MVESQRKVIVERLVTFAKILDSYFKEYNFLGRQYIRIYLEDPSKMTDMNQPSKIYLDYYIGSNFVIGNTFTGETKEYSYNDFVSNNRHDQFLLVLYKKYKAAALEKLKQLTEEISAYEDFD